MLSTPIRARPLLANLANLANGIRRDSLLRNSIYIMAITVVTSALGYIYWIVAARLYSPEAVGLASAIVSAMSITAAVSSVGIGHALVQILPRRQAGEEWSLALNAGLIVGLLVSLLAAIVAAAIIHFVLELDFGGQETIYIIAFIASVPLWTLGTLLDQAFVAERAAGNALLRNVAFAALKIPLLALPFLWTLGALAIFNSWVISTVASLAVAGVLALRLGRRYRLTVQGIAWHARSMLSAFAGHHLIGLGGIAPLYLLPILVTVRLSTEDNAYFYPASMTGTIFFMVSSSVALALFAEGSHTTEDIAHKVRSSALIIACLLCPMMLVTFVGRHFILSLFGSSYAQRGEVLLAILIVSAIPDAITNIYVAWLRVRRHLRFAALLNLGIATVTLVLAWTLLPALGIAGAGWASLAAQTAGSLVVGIHLTTRRFGAGPLGQKER